jgi:hypothetical protein
MTAWNPYSFARSATWVLLLLLCAQSNALARAGGFLHDPPFSSERIDRLPSEVQSAVRHMCTDVPTAAHYFATFFDNARIIKLRFEDLRCEGRKTHHELDRCLREEFVRSGTHYHLLKTYYAQCGD